MNHTRSSVLKNPEMNEKIHSGQFMVSKYDEESDCEYIVDNNVKQKDINFNPNLLEKNLQFLEKRDSKQKLEIDDSLSTMFQYLSIAMSGKISNPKWNSFKGAKLKPKDKIRLNNIIWREYHMQFVKKLKPVVVQFESPLSDILQINGDAILEGKYWKRKINIVVDQYKQWREFSKNRDGATLFATILVQRSLHHTPHTNSPPPNFSDVFMDLDDLNLPIDDITGVEHNSQIIQPQLNNLLPRMESSFDFLNDYFCAPHKTIKSQKPFSSETGLNDPRQTYLEHRIERNIPLGSEYPFSLSQSNKRKSGCDLHHTYQEYSFQSPNKDDPCPLAPCRTPYLLSILLQPTHTISQMNTQQTVDIGHGTVTTPKKQSLVIPSAGSDERGRRVLQNGSIISADVFERKLSDKPRGIDSTDHSLQPSKLIRPVPNSEHNHSSREKHSLTANNLVQHCLDELCALMMHNHDQSKLSKAALLRKASEHIKVLRLKKHKLQSEIFSVQNEIDSLQTRFSAFCSQLPATGLCLSDNNSPETNKWFENFVTKHSFRNWKFYVFSMMFESLFTCYNNSVSTLSSELLANHIAAWLEKECSLLKLRLIVINGMRTLSRRTSIVHNPRHFEDEVRKLIETKWSP